MADITIKSLEGKSFGGYCALPTGGRGPGLIVIQEIFGVNSAMRELCDAYASKGYIAICPDLFWRLQPGIQLNPKEPAEMDAAMDLFKQFDAEAAMRDLLSTLGHIRAMPACAGKVGAVGYCLGGKLAFLMAARSDVEAAVSYYGVGLDQLLDEVHDIRMPLIVDIAGLDSHVPPPVRDKIVAALARNPAITAYVYPEADHGFARPHGRTYNAAAAELANQRTDAFFAKNLQG